LYRSRSYRGGRPPPRDPPPPLLPLLPLPLPRLGALGALGACELLPPDECDPPYDDGAPSPWDEPPYEC
jgi:hypothetical protein